MQDWERMVGKLIIKTGEIEFILSQLYWNLSLNEAPSNFHLPDKFSERVKRAIPIIENSFIEKPFKKEISNILHECLKLGKLRNHVAHNTVYLETYIDTPLEVKHKEAIGSLSGPRINYQELCEAAEKAASLAKKLSEVAGDQRIWKQKKA